MSASTASCISLFLCCLPHVAASFWNQHAANINFNHDEDLQLDPEHRYPVISHEHLDTDEPPSHRYLKAKGEPDGTYFSIRLAERKFGPTSPGDLMIKIHNPKSVLDYWYSVTVVSPGEYTGVAKFLRQVTDRPGNPLLYEWTPQFSGEYRVIVHELAQRVDRHAFTMPMTTTFRSEKQPIVVRDKPGHDTRQHVINKIGGLTPCQSEINKPRYNLFTTWDGSWIGPNLLQGIDHMRTGWYFLPAQEMNCKLEYFTDKDLSMIPEEKSIYILGSSKERGVFLSLVDMLLDDNEKEKLNDSVLSKCWGRAFVVKKNLKVLYQDWRSNYFQHLGSTQDAICHSDKVVQEGGSTFTENGLKVWEEIFLDQSSWPSVILMSVGNGYGHDNSYDLTHFISSLPPTWGGTLFLTDGAFSAIHAGRGADDMHNSYRKRIKDQVAGFHDTRVKWLDGTGISKEMRFYSEDGPNHMTRSNHFHGHCEQQYLAEDVQVKTMKICSNITEMLGQLLLGHVLGPKDEFIERAKQSGSYHTGNNKEVMYCHACPLDLLPFHITPHPDMTCDSGPLHPRDESEVDRSPSLLCPAKCLEEVPVSGGAQTQSGIVDVRKCPVEYFMTDVEEINQIMKEIDHMTKESNAAVPPIAPEITAVPPVTSEVRMVEQMVSPVRENDGTDELPASLDVLTVCIVVVLILLFLNQPKVRALIRKAARKPRNPYTSSTLSSFNVQADTILSKKSAFVAGALIGIIFGISLSHVQKNDRSLQASPYGLAATAKLAISHAASLATTEKSIRPIMSTFFEPTTGGCCGMTEEGHLNLVKAWEEGWQSAGWDTRVLNGADAKKHPKFDSLTQRLNALGISEYEHRCFWRWLAMANTNDEYGGWMSDYDTFPLTLTGEKALEIMSTSKPGFHSYSQHVPALIYGKQESWENMVDLMIEHARPDLDTKYGISDFVILIYLRDNYDLEKIGIVTWTADVLNGFPYFPSDIHPTIDCNKANNYLAVHLSHASSDNDYKNLHTYPRIEGMNEGQISERKGEAAAIMLKDFNNECYQ